MTLPAADSTRERLWRALLAVGGGALALLVYWADVASRPEVPVANAYLAPIAAVAWVSGTAAAFGVAALTTVLSAAANADESVVGVLLTAALHGSAAWLIGSLRLGFDRERRLARTDAVTGAPNRRAFDEDARELVRAHLRGGQPLTAVIIDLDGFKGVNDTLGHDAGDEVLRAVASALTRAVRGADVVARYGGDEFAVILANTDAVGAGALLPRLHEALDGAMARRGWPVTFSIGAVTFDRPPRSERQLMRLVDARMYEAKHGGKNRLLHTVHEPSV